MKIQFIATAQDTPERKYTNSALFTAVRQAVEQDNGLSEDNTAPDVLHLFGNWSVKALHTLEKARQKLIPTIFTSLDGLQAIAAPTATELPLVRKTVQSASIIHTCGPVESELFSRYIAPTRIKCIENATLSNRLSVAEMGYRFCRLYRELAMEHEQHIKAQIDHTIEKTQEQDESIRHICSNLLYAHYAMRRGHIPQSLLEATARMLLQNDYDEDRLSVDTERIDLYRFTARILWVLGEKQLITEGFMPIEPLHDKQAEQLLKLCGNQLN